MLEKHIKSTSGKPIMLQFELWAELFFLLPDEEIIIGLGENEGKGYEIERGVDIWYVHFPFAYGYGIIESGEVIEHGDYGSNAIGYSKPLHPKLSLKGSMILNHGKTK